MERCVYDPDQPTGTMSLDNMRNTLRGLHQGDLLALKPYVTEDLTVGVSGTDVSDYYWQVYVNGVRLELDDQESPAITPPSANPRIDILTIDDAGDLAWTVGTENSSPVMPTVSDKTVLPICAVYCKPTMAKVVTFEDAAGNPDEGYILHDLRPIVNWPKSSVSSGAAASAPASPAVGDVYASTDKFNLKVCFSAGTWSDLLPTGIISIWSGTLANIPDGWLLCDGTSGTPDLRDKFIVGTTVGVNPGTTGGSHTLTLATANLPGHTHTFSATSGTQSASHTHTSSGTTGSGGSHSGHTNTSTTVVGGGGSINHGNASAGSHTHSFSATSGNQSASHTHSVSGTSGSTGSGTAITIKPAYYEVAYIYKA